MRLSRPADVRTAAPRPVRGRRGAHGPDADGGPRIRRHGGLLATIALLAVAALMIAVLPPFHAEAIDITPTRAMTSDAILKTSGLEAGQHLLAGLGGSPRQLFTLRYGAAEQRLRDAFPYIRSVEARLDFPGRITVTIDERIEVSYLRIPDGCVLVDKEAYALRVLAVPPAGIPIVEGITVRQMSIGSPLTVDLPESLKVALSLMGAIIDADKDTRSTVRLMPAARRIRPVSDRDVYLTLVLPQTGEELTVLARVSQSLAEDMVWLRFAIIQGALDHRGKGVLDMTGERKVFIPDRA